MSFSKRLKQAMQDLGINQVQVAGLTGKSKGSISQYLSGKQTPSEGARRGIAVALGLDPDYFEMDNPVMKIARRGGTYIPEIRPRDAGKLMRMNHCTIEAGLKQGIFPWGYAIKTGENRYRYFINAQRFADIEGLEVPAEMVV